MRTRWKQIALLLITSAACSDPQDTPDAGITVVAGADLSDTVATTFVQALVVEVTTPTGLAEGVVVRFESLAAPDSPAVLVAPIVGMSPFDPVTTIATDSRGRASVRLQFGTIAGPAELHITVPELGYSATVPYTVKPGMAVSITAAPQDTVVPVGASFTSRSTVVDQFGNPLDQPVALAEPTPNLAVDGTRITANGPGRGSVTLHADGLSEVLFVFVGPLSEITGLTETELVRFAINGDVSAETSLGHSGGPVSADWSANGELLVADDQGGGPLRVIQPNGQVFTLPTVGDAWPLYPEFSPDGQWIYYSRSDLGWHIRRVHPDGSADQPVPVIPTNHSAPSLSPDGTRMAVVNLVPDRVEVYEFATGVLREIAADAHSPAFSPDGARIAFVNTRTGEIEVINPDGSGRRVISPAGRRFRIGIDWTQDGFFVVGSEVDSDIILAIDPESGTTIEYTFPGIGAPAARPR